MSKCIQFVLSASLVLCLNAVLFAQTNERQTTSIAGLILPAYNHNPMLASDQGSANPQTHHGYNECWTQTTLGTSEEPALLFDDVEFSASVNMNVYCRGRLGDYNGRFVFYDGDTMLGSVESNNFQGAFDTESLTAGRHRIKVTFESESYYQLSSAELRQDVDKWPAPTTLSSSANPSTYGQDVTFTVSVTSDIENPTGKVRFSDGTKAIGIATLDENGMATFTKKNLAVGTHSITAEYYGDAISAKTTAPVLTQVVN